MFRLSKYRKAAAVAGLAAALVIPVTSLSGGVASADPYTGYTLSVSPTAPVAPRYYEGVTSTVRVAGSETALYPLQGISDIYSATGVFGCTYNSDKRTCATSTTNPSGYKVTGTTDIYDNFDHDEINQGGAIGSAAGSAQLCGEDKSANGGAAGDQITSGDNGLPVDVVRASASLAGLAEHGATTCANEAQLPIARDTVTGLYFPGINPTSFGATTSNPAPSTLDLSNTGGPGSSTDTAYRLFCDTGSDRITNWSQLGGANAPVVLWGPANNSGTGVTFYDFAGCTAGSTGNVPSSHLITENNAEQMPAYAAQDCAGSGPSAPSSSLILGTAAYTPAIEACVANELADSVFFISYGYYSSHPTTASVTIPTSAQGDTADYQSASVFANEAVVEGSITTINGSAITGRVNGAGSAATARFLYLDYLTDQVRASAAGFLNWVCDAGDTVAPKGIDPTTNLPVDGEITTAFSNWAFPRQNCDSTVGGNPAPAITGVGSTTGTNGVYTDPGAGSSS